MMSPRFLCLVLVVVTVFLGEDGHSPGCSAFTPASSSGKKPSLPSSTKVAFPLTSLREKVGATYYPSAVAVLSAEDQAKYVLERARAFAFGDDYDHDDDLLLHGDSSLDYWPIEEAKFWLHEMATLMQSEGEDSAPVLLVVQGEGDASTADIATRLRSKIERHERRIAKRKG
jgi:hypothetical protein